MKLTSFDTTGKQTQLTVSDAVFAAKPNQVLLAQAIRVYRANQRQGTSDVKTRGEVARTTKKWFKQKGTGNARHGSRKAPIFVGGGVAHGPKANQNWSLALNAKAKRAALATAFTLQAAQTVVSSALNDLNGKTAAAVQALTQAGATSDRVLVIVGSASVEQIRSLRNLATVVVQTATRVTALEVAMAKQLVLTPDAVTVLEKRIGEQKVRETESKSAAPVAKKAVAKKSVTKVAEKTEKVEKTEKKATKATTVKTTKKTKSTDK